MTVTAEIGESRLAELVKQVQEGNEVVITKDNRPVAKLVQAGEPKLHNGSALRVRSLKGHRVLSPVISQAELADELFDRR